ncbi:aspartate carbamoyltransferase catalytic subunit [Nodularia spumigena CS-584]|jgi:aspartate carbamoyltransferase catalytic subunit|uniref:Aspartate carbamoyltransferase n=1 Tax=Nodularia spumigena UHCC 0060 TaxID=3110300 RepID=A0ABU5UPV8_NODSP|nr:aspartate carbamoyltransferase catalytic subunit [Nodularia spumigena]AHJ29109.1 Aspartate carbamoyltransferase [Nodularia spumigena CCY9414]EAW46313.1 aspartate carbamoyltransferase catalytic subunit [Nodularia spumigena CCY9414]MDB9381344.1 aspartate carbamoyltransferase catalytic subunit [Nodularia spumigena CS-584]MEA5526255.1 aspartate carbamoyltransferase catalytic subunit [Nodularia spumigena UHCC 0143]MEA5608315.1 aspartate carbamoyltransferase catalytic subunit [Nodularia spumigena
MPTTTWNRHHVLSLADFTTAEYDTVLQTAASFQEVLSRRTKKVPSLQGQVVANLFFEPSTRTRSSFELAAKRLSADTLNFAAASSSMTKGETILDTAKTYLAMGTDIMVIRHREAGVPNAIAQEMDRLDARVSVLNAGDGQHEHPSQALLDLFTICSLINRSHPRLELLKDKKIAIVGDILHSRVARSNIWSLTASGAQVHLAAPPTLLPKLFKDFVLETGETENAQSQTASSPILNRQLFLHWDLESALQDADLVMTLRLQKERMTAHLLPSLREYHQTFGITRKKLQLCKPNVKVLHPGPVNRGVEISSDLMDDPEFSLIQSQVTSGIAIRMALLYLLGSGKDAIVIK